MQGCIDSHRLSELRGFTETTGRELFLNMLNIPYDSNSKALICEFLHPLCDRLQSRFKTIQI